MSDRAIKGVAAPMLRDNIDTDIIYPARFYTLLDGFETVTFYDWRFNEDGSDNPSFILNKPEYAETRIILAGDNFGCGSSREHAVWGIMGLGIKAVIAPSFAEIFYDNALKKGLLPVILDKDQIQRLVQGANSTEIEINLQTQTVRGANGVSFPFKIDARRRKMLLTGMSSIELTLEERPKIEQYQAEDAIKRPWIYNLPAL